MSEEWRVIDEFPDYAVSNLGRVKRIRDSRCGSKAGRLLSLTPGGNGYPIVQLWNQGIGKSKLVHELVLKAFVGHRPFGYTANHKDCNKTNNCLNNLEWVTQSENVFHSYRVGSHIPIGLKGGNNGTSKLRDNEAWLIKRLLASGIVKQKTIATMFKVTPETISYINCGQRYADVGCKGFAPRSRGRILAVGQKIGCSKLKDGEVWLIKRLLANGLPHRLISGIFRINKSQISRINTGERWGHIAYPRKDSI